LHKTVFYLAALILLPILFLFSVFADSDQPYGPDTVSQMRSERANFSTQGAKQVNAQAGNVTQLTINTTVVTKRWQGYFGNITGEITLDDANGNTMYNWAQGDISAVGEIYAANDSIGDWSDVICLNFSSIGDGTDGGSLLNLTKLETVYNMDENDKDGINETFYSTEDVIVGLKSLLGCPATYLYQNNAQVEGTWNETLLTENQTTTIIYASEVSPDTIGFDGNIYDFQMIVGENGDDPTSTAYYFYVELA
jgi:hypothetical protein